MANIKYTLTATFKAVGITPAAGPKPAVDASYSFAPGAIDTGDYFSNTFVVNSGTTATAVSLGKITTGKSLIIETDQPIQVTLTQDLGAGPVDNVQLVNKFLMIDTEFTAVQIANAGGTSANIVLSAAGTRDAVGAGAGIF